MKARAVLAEIAQAAWECGDPGVQFDTIINDWHTCPNSGRINGSNPCSEYMHIDNSACNLASINLMQYLREDGTFMAREFAHTVDIFTTAMDIIVAGSSYPTEQIGKNARDFRQLGLGFANLGALLMTKGIAYDSAEGAAWAGSIAALMTGEAYRWSAIIASHVGPFAGYAVNRDPMLRVIEKHLAAAKMLPVKQVDDKQLVAAAKEAWVEALKAGRKWGYRNSQASVIAPTGTISFMMDCDTTGIEPDFSLVKMKQLVGGGWMKIVNGSVTRALRNLGYTASEAKDIVDYITDAGAIEGAPHLRPEHLSVFDTAVKPMNGTRSISWRGHIRIVAAVQPFISGAISKTFNMPAETTKEEISEAYVMAWKMGIKAFAVYRDGSKGTQPLNTEMKKKDDSATETAAPREAVRQKLPDVRRSETHKFVVAGHQGYLTYSAYDDGRLAEMFVRMAKQGSTLSGLLDALALATSINLQYGVPLKVLAAKFIYTRFEPAGFTENPEIQIATSILDYIFRYLSLRFLPDTDLAELGMSRVEPLLVESGGAIEAMPVSTHTSIPTPAPVPATVSAEVSPHAQTPKSNGNGNKVVFSDSVCRKCGGMMVRTGTCNTCLQCGTSSGGCS
jgi:ribonucleoside-diphosphate reductase alpha chain